MDAYREPEGEPVINAAGTLTRYSGSVMWPEESDAMAVASRKFVDMGELHEAVGRRIAGLIAEEVVAGRMREVLTGGERGNA